MAEQGLIPGADAIAPAVAAPPAPRRLRLDIWSLGPLALAGLIALPVLAVLGQLLLPAGDVWRHLAETVLARYVVNSLLLGAGVGICTAVLGVTAAWLVTFYRFPGSRVFPELSHSSPWSESVVPQRCGAGGALWLERTLAPPTSQLTASGEARRPETPLRSGIASAGVAGQGA